MSPRLNLPALVLLTTTCAASSSFAAINVYVSAPKSQNIDASIMNSSTENFNSVGTGNFTTYLSTVNSANYVTTTGTASIIANNQYGGSGQGNYLGINANSTVTITLTTARQYFGIYYTAADPNNSIQLLSAGTVIATFSTATLLNFLPNNATSTVRATDGSVYNTNQYYGQPTSGVNANEAYAYLSFIGTAGTTFNQIRLTQAGGAIFENDNHSFVTTAPTVPGSYVLIPEPSTYALLGLGALGLFFVRRKRVT